MILIQISAIIRLLLSVTRLVTDNNAKSMLIVGLKNTMTSMGLQIIDGEINKFVIDLI